MRKLLTMIALVGALAASQCLALTVNVTRISGYYSGHGGEFNVSDAADPLFITLYNQFVPVTQVNGGFETFCGNSTVPIQLPGTYIATIGAEVDYKVGYLFFNFAKGTLAGYDYTPGVGRETQAFLLQQAIWQLLGQPNDGSGAAYVALANANADPANPYGIHNLDLFTRDQQAVQPVLVPVPHNGPDGGLTVMLLGLGLAGLGWFSRRCKA